MYEYEPGRIREAESSNGREVRLGRVQYRLQIRSHCLRLAEQSIHLFFNERECVCGPMNAWIPLTLSSPKASEGRGISCLSILTTAGASTISSTFVQKEIYSSEQLGNY